MLARHIHDFVGDIGNLLGDCTQSGPQAPKFLSFGRGGGGLNLA